MMTHPITMPCLFTWQRIHFAYYTSSLHVHELEYLPPCTHIIMTYSTAKAGLDTIMSTRL